MRFGNWKFYCMLSESGKLRKDGGVVQNPGRKITKVSDFHDYLMT